METKQIEINNQPYTAYIADTEELRRQGLENTSEINSDECMLFIFDEPLSSDTVAFTCENMSYDISILFCSNDEIVDIQCGKAGSQEPIVPNTSNNIDYVIELLPNDTLSIGDEIDLDPEEVSQEEIEKLYILGSDGQPQGIISSGSRIFSRIDSRNLIKKAKKANKTKSDSDYKKLGKLVFQIMHKHDVQEPEFVESPN